MNMLKVVGFSQDRDITKKVNDDGTVDLVASKEIRSYLKISTPSGKTFFAKVSAEDWDDIIEPLIVPKN